MYKTVRLIALPIFKFAVLVFLCIAITKTVNWELLIEDFLEFKFTSFHFLELSCLLIAITLMPINWVLESKKWQILMNNEFSLKVSIRQILIGRTIGLITPLGLGDYFGRTLSLKPDDKLKSIKATFLSSLAQNIVILSLGSLSLLGLSMSEIIGSKGQFILSIFTIMVSVLVFCFYFRYHSIYKFLKRNISRIPKKFDMAKVDDQLKWDVLNLSLWRYIIFTTQYVLILYFFGCQNNVFLLFSSIGILFLGQSIFPLPLLSSLVLRLELAVIIWGVIGIAQLDAMLITTTVWVINICVPSLIGMIYLIKMK